jgi:hypothetical protein
MPPPVANSTLAPPPASRRVNTFRQHELAQTICYPSASVILLIDMPTSELIGVSEYLHTSYRPGCNYVDGFVLRRNIPAWKHADSTDSFAACFRTRRNQWNIQAVPECRGQVAPARFRIPGVSVILAQGRHEPVLRRPPFIRIEALSTDPARQAYRYTPQSIPETAVFRTENPEIVVPLDAVIEL